MTDKRSLSLSPALALVFFFPALTEDSFQLHTLSLTPSVTLLLSPPTPPPPPSGFSPSLSLSPSLFVFIYLSPTLQGAIPSSSDHPLVVGWKMTSRGPRGRFFLSPCPHALAYTTHCVVLFVIPRPPSLFHPPHRPQTESLAGVGIIWVDASTTAKRFLE